MLAPSHETTMASLIEPHRRPPFVIGVSMVKNEGDIIEPFVRHNLRFLDMLFVADNLSCDRTREILVHLQQEGLPVVVFEDPNAAYVQAEKMTRMARTLSSTAFPDFLVPLDADEFIRCPSKESFLASLSSIPPSGAGYVPWVTYVMRPEDAAAPPSDPPRAFSYRRREESPQYYKVVLRVDGRHDPFVLLAQGNHSASRTGGREIPGVLLRGVALGHYPVRGEEQLAAKAVTGWMAYLVSNPEAHDAGQGLQWRDNCRRVLECGGIPKSELPSRAMLYAQAPRTINWAHDVVHDPMSFDYVRLYSDGTQGPALGLVARSWEYTLRHKTTFSQGFAVALRDSTFLSNASSSPLPAQALSAQWHAADPFVDIPPFRYLADRFAPASVLDVGCGLGAYLLFLKTVGAKRVMGVDGMGETLLSPSEYRQVDLSLPFSLKEKFDLVLCTEVAEHLPEACERSLISSIATHAQGMIVFSAASPGQPGVGHINCKNLDHWLGMWDEHGWIPDEVATFAFRSLSTFSWLRRNPVVLKRCEVRCHERRSSFPDLIDIAKRPCRWYAQNLQVVEHPFLEEPPPDLYPDHGPSPLRGRPPLCRVG